MSHKAAGFGVHISDEKYTVRFDRLKIASMDFESYSVKTEPKINDQRC